MTQGQVLAGFVFGFFFVFFFNHLTCVCVGGGGRGPVSSFKVNYKFPKFQGGGGVQHMLSRGGGFKLFFQGDGVQLLSDRTYDLYWAPFPALDPRNNHEF